MIPEDSWLWRLKPRLRLPFPGHRGFYYVHSSATGPHWVEPERVIYDHELVLFSGGSFTVTIQGVEYPCPPDSFIIVPPGLVHASWNSGGTSGYRRWVHFDWAPGGPEPGGQAMTFARGPARPEWVRPAPAFVPREILRGKLQNPKKVYGLHRDLALWLDRFDLRTFHTGSGLLLSLLLEILAPITVPPRKRRTEDFLAEKVRDLLDATVEKGPPIPETGALLESLGASHEHASRSFRRRYGVSPHSYLQSLRMTRAKLLLQSGKYRVHEVADLLGFDDLSWFSQWFRKQTGQTPGAFIREKN